jgi:hypothetical protein
VWQVLYEECKDDGFEVIAVALDTGGRSATEPSIRCRDLAERPAAMAPLMGWTDDLWQRMAPPQYPCLIDEEHALADLYGIVNVPLAVWVDEDGRIVRPAEPAGASDNFRRMDPATFSIPADEIQRLASNRRIYWDAIRDWVRKGRSSEFALSADQVRARLHRPSADEVRAAAHARIARIVLNQGHHEAAKRHLREAARLAPERWNYRRQSMVLDSELIGELNTAPEYFEAIDRLGTNPYYATIDIPGIRQDPLAKPAGDSPSGPET